MLLAAALQPGHLHGSVGITIGPLALRVLLLTAVMVVAAFASLRGFTGPPDHRTAVWTWSAAATVVVVELLLSGGLDVPRRVIPLVLAATGAPAYAIFSRDRRWAAIRGALSWPPGRARRRPRSRPWSWPAPGSPPPATNGRRCCTRTSS